MRQRLESNDHPEVAAVYWFSLLCTAMRERMVHLAVEADRELERRGITVKFGTAQADRPRAEVGSDA